MPDVDSLIRDWKRSLTVVFGGAAELVEQLEKQLHEEMEQLTQAGKTREVALSIAQTKLGSPVELAAEYARTTIPESWPPIRMCQLLILLPFVCCSGLFLLNAPSINGVETRGLLRAILVISHTVIVAGTAFILYSGFLTLCYVVSWIFRPIGLGLRRSLGQAIFLANVVAAILHFIGLGLGLIVLQRYSGQAWTNHPQEFGLLVRTLWFTMAVLLWWTLPRKQHLWILLSALGISVCMWGWFGPHLILHWHEYASDGAFMSWMAVITVVPLGTALLGMLLPPGCLTNRIRIRINPEVS